MKRYRFAQAALAEYEAAAAWYIEHSEGAAVGKAFVAAIEKTISRIRRSPKAYPRMPEPSLEIRRCVVRRFPYAIAYVERAEEVVIVAVAHTSRAPGYWADRPR